MPGWGIAAAGLTAVAAWGPPGVIGTPVTGPWWLRALLRRRAPLLMWTAVWAGMARALTLDRPVDPQFGPDPRTPEPFTFVLFVAAYSLGAHAGPARAQVAVSRARSAVTIEVTDDGPGNPAPPALTGGQGLAGMRERVAVSGGDLRAGAVARRRVHRLRPAADR
jgi:hypothetical protein